MGQNLLNRPLQVQLAWSHIMQKESHELNNTKFYY